MKVALVTDTWPPHTGVEADTWQALVRALALQGHEVDVIHPGRFSTRWAVPGWPGVGLTLWPHRALDDLLRASRPEAIHLATVGPLGWAARRVCLQRGWAFTTAFHCPVHDIWHTRHRLPRRWGLAVLRWFHSPSSGVLVASQSACHTLSAHGFERLRVWSPGVDATVFAHSPQPKSTPWLGPLPHPVLLSVGRVAPEENLPDFLKLDMPGSKVVCGSGPALRRLKAQYPEVHWLPPLPPAQRAALYASADVLVFAGRSDTLGTAMLESMACGTPVAAYPTDRLRELLGQGGATAADLNDAVHRALAVPRHQARARALAFNWPQAAQQFARQLVQIKEHSTQYSKELYPYIIYKNTGAKSSLSPIRHTSGK